MEIDEKIKQQIYEMVDVLLDPSMFESFEEFDSGLGIFTETLQTLYEIGRKQLGNTEES